MEEIVKKLPVVIDPCPIEEAIFEIRYSSKIPSEARFGMLYGAIGDLFSADPIPLSILQLPEAIRSQDPNLKYKAHHQFKENNHTINVGPDVLTFSTLNPYCGWKEWSAFFYKILEKIFAINLISRVERIGLRYINRFDHNIFEKIQCEVKIIDTLLTDESTSLRTEIIDEKFTKILQIGNSITMLKDDKPIHCSVIDIDILSNIEDTQKFIKEYNKIVERAHIKEKELFFSLLNESFLEDFNPNYGG